MPQPMAVCIEDLDAESRADRFLRCVAVIGRQPGLRLDLAGQVLWKSDDQVSCELWVSADEKLILYRPENALPVTLHRAGRSLQVPIGKPVVVADQDQVDVGSKRLRIHLHGPAPAVSAPSPLPTKSRKVGTMVRAAAVVGALSAMVGCTDNFLGTPTIDIRDEPPVVALPDPDQSLVDAIMGNWQVRQAFDQEGEHGWFTGTLTIDGDRYSFATSQVVTGTLQGQQLDFLVDHPQGSVYIDYWIFEDLGSVTPGDTVATCQFHTDNELVSELEIRVKDASTLQFHDPSADETGWSISKQLTIDTE